MTTGFALPLPGTAVVRIQRRPPKFAGPHRENFSKG
jgi:hypothetical protein